MKKNEIKAIKRLGQNFLNDTNIIDIMITALDVQDNNQIVEIGGGQGAITSRLLKLNSIFNLDVYEIDTRFQKLLNDLAKDTHIKTTVFNEDFLQINLNERYKNQTLKVIGAIPYYITSPIIHTLLKMNNMPKTIVLLIQKEVAEKIASDVPKSNYWSMFTSMYTKTIIQTVNSKAFTPAPKVRSAILKLELKTNTFPIPMQNWSKFLHMIYKNPRKMLNKAFNLAILEEAQIEPSLRPQNLSLAQCIRLYDIMKSS